MFSHLLAAAAGALPTEETPIVGRRREVAEVSQDLVHGALVTLVGPAGVGKTRIAIRVAHRVRRNFRDGVVFVDLLGVRTDRHLLETVASAVGLHVASSDIGAALLSYLRAKKILVVLDNCEHLVEPVAEVASALLRSCPGISVLATSRELLRVRGERLQVIAPFVSSTAERNELERHSAAQLFLERAKPFISEPVSAADLDVIMQICDRLDHLPLAIELAAARTSVLSIAQLLVELRRPLEIATRGARHGDVRHQTLRGAIQWSYDLCNRYEQAAWRCFSIFGAAWDIDAGTALLDQVVAKNIESIDIHQALLEKSILQRVERDGRTRYSLLAAVRDFGREMLTAVEVQRAQRAHRDWYIRRLREAESDWQSPRQAEWLDYFRYELPNIRAAAEFALTDHEHPDELYDLLSTGWRLVWQADGRTDELRDWLSRALSVGHASSPSRAMAHGLHAVLVGIHGDVDLALAELAAIRAELEHSGDTLLVSYIDGALALFVPDPKTSVDLFETALAVQAGNPAAEAHAGTAVCLTYTLERLGRTADAETLRNRLLAEAKATGEQYDLSGLLLISGAAALSRNETELAADLTRRALQLQRRLRSTIGIAYAIQTLAGVALRAGAPSQCAFLLGLAHTAWKFTAVTPTWPHDPRVNAEEYERETIGLLGQREYQRHFDSGAHSAPEEAVAAALGEPTNVRTPRGSATLHALTAREAEVADLVAEGLTNREIAERMTVSIRTVHGHVQRILTKLVLTSRTQVAILRMREYQDRAAH